MSTSYSSQLNKREVERTRSSDTLQPKNFQSSVYSVLTDLFFTCVLVFYCFPKKQFYFIFEIYLKVLK